MGFITNMVNFRLSTIPQILNMASMLMATTDHMALFKMKIIKYKINLYV